MRLPRDLSASDLEKALRRVFGYEANRQRGSHRRLTTQAGGEHHLTLPAPTRSNQALFEPSSAKWPFTIG